MSSTIRESFRSTGYGHRDGTGATVVRRRDGSGERAPLGGRMSFVTPTHVQDFRWGIRRYSPVRGVVAGRTHLAEMCAHCMAPAEECWSWWLITFDSFDEARKMRKRMSALGIQDWLVAVEPGGKMHFLVCSLGEEMLQPFLDHIRPLFKARYAEKLLAEAGKGK